MRFIGRIFVLFSVLGLAFCSIGCLGGGGVSPDEAAIEEPAAPEMSPEEVEAERKLAR